MSLKKTALASLTAAGNGASFECNVTPNMVKHNCIIELDASGQTGGTLKLQSSDDGTTWVDATDDAGNNITVNAGDPPTDFAFVLPNYIRPVTTSQTGGTALAAIKASN